MIASEKEKVLTMIDETIRYMWTVDIAYDYTHCWLLKEDTLKNAMYHYLRTKLASLFDQYHVRIFTEFTDDIFCGSKRRPDVVIAEIDYDDEGACFIKECLCVIELKYKTGYAPHQDILNDYKKLQGYIEELGVECPMYMATIWEYEDDETTWIRKNAAWAKDRVTELNASYERGTETMRFYIKKH